MQHNPFIIPILNILRHATQRIGEYDLIQALERQGLDFGVADDSYPMAMFKKHFITMNALYQLQQSLRRDGVGLLISALDICIQPATSNSASTELVDEAERKVSAYYLDWRHLYETGEGDVERLLNSFWERYFSIEQSAQALKTLELTDDSDWDEIQQQYRKLASRHHPDKGGDASRFIAIREAYEVLRCRYG